MTILQQLVKRTVDGERRAIARLMTLIENDHADAAAMLSELFQFTGKGHIVGVTGAPGCGKSTLVCEIAKQIRSTGKSVGIIAVDPTSPYTGGALLGDRIRMRDLANDPLVFVRSMASRGSLGGLASKTSDLVNVLDAAGFDVIIIETVGAGQSEVDIAKEAHTTLVVVAPGMGDDIQAIKAGILEIADILVVNKADKSGAESTIKSLSVLQRMNNKSTIEFHHGQKEVVEGYKDSTERTWVPPIVPTIAIKGTGAADLLHHISKHLTYLLVSGEKVKRDRSRLWAELDNLITKSLLQEFRGRVSEDLLEKEIDRLMDRIGDPRSSAARLLRNSQQV